MRRGPPLAGVSAEFRPGSRLWFARVGWRQDWTISHADRLRLESLRYATVPEAAEYLAIIRTFAGEMSGLLSDQSASEVAARLVEQGIDIDVDTAEAPRRVGSTHTAGSGRVAGARESSARGPDTGNTALTRQMTARFAGVAPLTAFAGTARSNVTNRPPWLVARASR